MSFDGKSIIVTGATSGIGRATAEAFGKDGGSVVVVGRDETELTEVAAAVRDGGGQAVACRADVTAGDAPDRIVAAALAAFGHVDVVVNAAGVIASGALEATTDEVWDTMMAVNLRAPFRLMRAAAPHLTARKGSVVNVSSVNGLRSFPGVLAYLRQQGGRRSSHPLRGDRDGAARRARERGNPASPSPTCTGARGWTTRGMRRSSSDQRKRIRSAVRSAPRTSRR